MDYMSIIKGENQTRYPENDYFSSAVCLNEKEKFKLK